MAASCRKNAGPRSWPPFDDPDVITGQGTIGIEIAEQCAAIGAKPDAIMVCCGGGGLVSGTALALSHTMPGVPVYAVEPKDFDDTRRSLASGKRETNDPKMRSICDALLSPSPGALTFALNSKLLKGVLTVSDDEARAAMAIAFTEYKLVVEPGGAVAMASVLSGKYPLRGKTVVAVASGGNVDPALFAQVLGA